MKAVTEAGAQFAISPGLTEALLKAATEDGTIPLIRGSALYPELMLGMQYGLKEFKFFPAEANGGVKALQAIAGPFSTSVSARPAVSLRPTTVTTWR